VVALKQELLLEMLLDDLRSRNAVVALKRALDMRRGSGETEKQERRGGIETALAGVLFLFLANRSRNAVVALKPAGGGPARGSLLRKQERRGGIETRSESPDPGPPAPEAGTPWWH
jgi:hypothetical protein